MGRAAVLAGLARSKPTLAGRYRVTRLALFGSTARNAAHSGSDLDILSDTPTDLELPDRLPRHPDRSALCGERHRRGEDDDHDDAVLLPGSDRRGGRDQPLPVLPPLVAGARRRLRTQHGAQRPAASRSTDASPGSPRRSPVGCGVLRLRGRCWPRICARGRAGRLQGGRKCGILRGVP